MRTLRVPVVTSLALLLVGCGSSTPESSSTAGAGGGSASTSATTGPGTGSATGVEAPTWHEHMAPLLEAKCGSCHRDGGIAPFATNDLAAVKAWAGPIKKSVVEKTMPPWLAQKGCADYLADRSLTDDEIATVARWVDTGTPEGDPAAKPVAVPKTQEFSLSRVDLSMGMSAEYTPRTDPDDYHCFVLDWPKQDVAYVSGFRANPGNPKIVHHVIAYYIPPQDVDTVTKLDAAEDGPGYTCFGSSGTDAMWVGAWAPGGLGSDYPPGTGVKVEPGSKIVLQVHYNTLSAGRAPDKTTIDLKIDDKVAKEAWVQPWANPQWLGTKKMSIPANTKDVTHSFSFDATAVAGGKTLTMYTAGLHMHTLGHAAKLWIDRSSGEQECMLDIHDWNFHWQGSYAFEKPKTFHPGDKLSLECHWDNTTPKDLAWGEGTGDEMCLGTFYATAE